MRKYHPIDAILPRGRQGVLSATVLQPEKWWYLSDLARHLGVTPSSIQRELSSLAEAGVLERRRDGNRVYVRPDPACPFLPDLQGLLTKTAGVADAVRQLLEPFAPRIRLALLYGSTARGEERSGSDIDLLVVGDVRLSELAPSLQGAEKMLARPVNATVYSEKEFAQRRKEGHHFLDTVLRSQTVTLLGDANDMEPTAGTTARAGARHKRAGAR